MKHADIKVGTEYFFDHPDGWSKSYRGVVTEVTRAYQQSTSYGQTQRPKGREYIGKTWWYRASSEYGAPVAVAEVQELDWKGNRTGKVETLAFPSRRVLRTWEQHVAEKKAAAAYQAKRDDAAAKAAAKHCRKNKPQYERFQQLVKEKLGYHTRVDTGRNYAGVSMSDYGIGQDADYVKQALSEGPAQITLTLDQLFALLDA